MKLGILYTCFVFNNQLYIVSLATDFFICALALCSKLRKLYKVQWLLLRNSHQHVFFLYYYFSVVWCWWQSLPYNLMFIGKIFLLLASQLSPSHHQILVISNHYVMQMQYESRDTSLSALNSNTIDKRNCDKCQKSNFALRFTDSSLNFIALEDDKLIPNCLPVK